MAIKINRLQVQHWCRARHLKKWFRLINQYTLHLICMYAILWMPGKKQEFSSILDYRRTNKRKFVFGMCVAGTEWNEIYYKYVACVCEFFDKTCPKRDIFAVYHFFSSFKFGNIYCNRHCIHGSRHIMLDDLHTFAANNEWTKKLGKSKKNTFNFCLNLFINCTNKNNNKRKIKVRARLTSCAATLSWKISFLNSKCCFCFRTFFADILSFRCRYYYSDLSFFRHLFVVKYILYIFRLV